MKIALVVTGVSLVVGLLVSSSAQAQDKKGSVAVFAPVDALKWTDVPGAPGVQTSTVEGDATKGPHHFFLKFPAGFAAPVHHHTADHYGTIVKGTLVLTVDGVEHRLPVGSYVGFTQKTKHATKCDAGAECIMFIDARSAWDVVMADSKSATKK